MDGFLKVGIRKYDVSLVNEEMYIKAMQYHFLLSSSTKHKAILYPVLMMVRKIGLPYSVGENINRYHLSKINFALSTAI